MNNPLSGLGDLASLQKKALAMHAALQRETVTVEHNGITVEMRGDQQIISISIDGIVENRVAEAINEAIKKTQELAADKLKDMSSMQ